MRKTKILLYHLGVFLAGALGIAAYFFWKISALDKTAGLAGVVLLPIAVVYIFAFGIFCAISCAIWIAVRYVREKIARSN